MRQRTERREGIAARVEERADCGQYSRQWVIRLRRFMTAARISSQFRSGLHVRTMRFKSFDLLAGAICSDVLSPLVESWPYLPAKDIDWNALGIAKLQVRRSGLSCVL